MPPKMRVTCARCGQHKTKKSTRKAHVQKTAAQKTTGKKTTGKKVGKKQTPRGRQLSVAIKKAIKKADCKCGTKVEAQKR